MTSTSVATTPPPRSRLNSDGAGDSQQQQQTLLSFSPPLRLLVEPESPVFSTPQRRGTGINTTTTVSPPRLHLDSPNSSPLSHHDRHDQPSVPVRLDATTAAELARQRVFLKKKHKKRISVGNVTTRRLSAPTGRGGGMMGVVGHTYEIHNDTSSSNDADWQNPASTSSSAAAVGARRESNDTDWSRFKDPRLRLVVAAAAADPDRTSSLSMEQLEHASLDQILNKLTPKTNKLTPTATRVVPAKERVTTMAAHHPRSTTYDELVAAKDPERRVSSGAPTTTAAAVVPRKMIHHDWQQGRELGTTGTIFMDAHHNSPSSTYDELVAAKDPERRVSSGAPTTTAATHMIHHDWPRERHGTGVMVGQNNIDRHKNAKIPRIMVTEEESSKARPVGAAAAGVSSPAYMRNLHDRDGLESSNDPNEFVLESPPIESTEAMDPVLNVSSEGLVMAQPVTDIDRSAQRERIELLERQQQELEDRMEQERLHAIPAQEITMDDEDVELGANGELLKDGKGGPLDGKTSFCRRFLCPIVTLVIVVLAGVVIAMVLAVQSPTNSTVPPSITLPPTSSLPEPVISMAPTPIPGFKKFESNAELIVAVDSYLWNSSANTSLADTYGHPIGSWDVSKMTDFSNVFSAERNKDMATFTADLSLWDVSNGQLFSSMFRKAALFEGDLSLWDTSQATNMDYMFSEASSFTGDLSRWQTGQATTMSSMFSFASKFNSDLSRWDTRSLQQMDAMFAMATSFNSNLSAWNVASVQTMSSVFSGASNFTSDLSAWNVLQVRMFTEMFMDATSFSANLCPWASQIVQVEVTGMFENTACPNTTDPNLVTKTPFCYNCVGN